MQKDQRFTIRKTPSLVKMVMEVMKRRCFTSYSEAFVAAMREMWERHCEKDSTAR